MISLYCHSFSHTTLWDVAKYTLVNCRLKERYLTLKKDQTHTHVIFMYVQLSLNIDAHFTHKTTICKCMCNSSVNSYCKNKQVGKKKILEDSCSAVYEDVKPV